MNENIHKNGDHESVEEVVVDDDTEKDFTVKPVQYDISSYGADLDVEGLVNRLKRNDIYIPPFQRNYVWSQREASRFIESLLLGLPVPGIFLARERDSKRLLVIDGQQRLKTLQFFYGGFFNPKEDEKYKRVFELIEVQEQFQGKTYENLNGDDRITLNDSIIHATIVKQDAPKGDQSSIYHIFERLNTMGRKLSPQQIRVAIYHGFLIDELHDLNKHKSWREIYGNPSKTLKDEELILRFFALYYFGPEYTKPMKEFLNESMEKLIFRGRCIIGELRNLFIGTIDFIHDVLGRKAFRIERAINAAVYDSVMVGTAKRLKSGSKPKNCDFYSAYSELLKKGEYITLVSQSTADESNIEKRLEFATSAFEVVASEK
jgi:hypothetical protein